FVIYAGGGTHKFARAATWCTQENKNSVNRKAQKCSVTPIMSPELLGTRRECRSSRGQDLCGRQPEGPSAGCASWSSEHTTCVSRQREIRYSRRNGMHVSTFTRATGKKDTGTFRFGGFRPIRHYEFFGLLRRQHVSLRTI